MRQSDCEPSSPMRTSAHERALRQQLRPGRLSGRCCTVQHSQRVAQQQRAGAAVVEFALVAPLMILLTLGMMEIGRVVMVKQIMVNASREGARMAVLPGISQTEIVSQVQSELALSSVNGAQVTVTPSNLAAASAGTPVTVAISIPAANVSWIPNPVFTINTNLEASTTMRREGQ